MRIISEWVWIIYTHVLVCRRILWSLCVYSSAEGITRERTREYPLILQMNSDCKIVSDAYIIRKYLTTRAFSKRSVVVYHAYLNIDVYKYAFADIRAHFIF